MPGLVPGIPAYLERRANWLSNWFERLRHALGFYFVFARVEKTLWLDPAMATGAVERTIEKEDCVSVIALPHCATLPESLGDPGTSGFARQLDWNESSR
jgi:hypothetical protein